MFKCEQANEGGIMDVHFCYCGYYCAVEAKQIGGKASELQLRQLYNLILAGGWGIVAETVEQVRTMTRVIKNLHRKGQWLSLAEKLDVINNISSEPITAPQAGDIY